MLQGLTWSTITQPVTVEHSFRQAGWGGGVTEIGLVCVCGGGGQLAAC